MTSAGRRVPRLKMAANMDRCACVGRKATGARTARKYLMAFL